MNKSLSLTVGWLYPDLMSTYGDRGNIICLRKRCEWRDIQFEVVPINPKTTVEDLQRVDLIFGGGAQDRQQEIVMRDLKHKKNWIMEKIEAETPALFVCGSPQLMGKYYEPAEGQRIDGVGVFNIVSKHPGKGAQRCIGNIVAEVQWHNLGVKESKDSQLIVGFENHGGRTYLGENVKPFAKVVKGYGNNGEDQTEGVVYKNAVGCYFHGPLLPKNSHIADWIIQKALEVRYKDTILLTEIDDELELKAHDTVIAKLLH